MTLRLPILQHREPSGNGTLAALRGAIDDALENFPNVFPPNPTPVPQPGGEHPSDRVMGFFTDTTLCIGCKACEVACKQWNQLPSDGNNFSANSYDNTSHLSGTTWRHVSFKEETTTTGDQSVVSRLLMMSDVCKHCQSAPCQHACPTGSIVYNDFGDVYVQNDVCNGCGYCVTACPFGVIGRADHEHDDGHAHKCTLCMDRQEAGLTPACAKSCPTSSIQFGPVEDLRKAARARVEDLKQRGNERAYLYGADSIGDYGPLNAFFLLEDHPNQYNLPEAPPQPFRGQAKRYAAGLAVGVALAGLSSLLFIAGGKRRGR